MWFLGGLLFGGDVCAQELTEAEEALILGAIEDVENGDADKGVETLRGLREVHPENFVISFELGVAYSESGEYDRAIEIFRALERSDEVQDIVFQAEGNAYDYKGEQGRAMETYRRGLEKFPKSGALYGEIGNVHYGEGRYAEALKKYEEGISVAPSYASNYFRAAVLLEEAQPIQALFYEEMFRFLEPNTERSKAVSLSIAESYRGKVRYNVEEGRVEVLQKGSERDMEQAFAFLGGLSVAQREVTISSDVERLSLLNLAKVRRSLLNFLYTKKEMLSETASAVVEIEKQIEEAGHWTAFCMWQMIGGGKEEVNEWMQTHENDMENFAQWFGKKGEGVISKAIEMSTENDN